MILDCARLGILQRFRSRATAADPEQCPSVSEGFVGVTSEDCIEPGSCGVSPSMGDES